MDSRPPLHQTSTDPVTPPVEGRPRYEPGDPSARLMGLPVLITDGEQRAALAVVRSLGRAGHLPYVSAAGTRSLAAASRFARGSAAVPDPLADPAGFIEALRRLIDRWGIRLLIPMTEPSLLAVLGAREGFPEVIVPTADLDRFRAISDKQTLLDIAPRYGISVPKQQTLRERGDPVPPDLRYPVVGKPARSVGEAAGHAVKTGVVHAANREELDRHLEALPEQAWPLLLQQRIVGPGVGVFLLEWGGHTVAAFSHRRIREKPPAGGVSTYRESIPLEPSLLERSRQLVRHFGWTGVAMVEYKVEESTGTPYLMEINGRFWGSLQLAIDAGVDFPEMLVDLALGGNPEPVMKYRQGIRSRWWWGDVDHLLLRLVRSNAELSLPPGGPSRSRAVLDFMKLWRPGDRSEVLRLTDPLPFLHESIAWFFNR